MHPTSIKDDPQAGLLELIWSDGQSQQFTHAYLRSQCNCADCKSLRSLTGNPLSVASTVRIREIRPVGAYGMQLIFDDGHERGIYPWVYLHQMGD